MNIEFESSANCLFGSSTTGATDFSASLWVDYIFLDTDERRRFAQLSHEYLIEQLQYTGDESITGNNNRVKLNFNHPVKELVWVVQRDAAESWTNFATDSNATTNVVSTAKLQLNGHDRFAERAGTYFNLVQPFQHHTNIPTNVGINVYSFALQPEEHQPSGTLNMSRIDTAVLNLQTTGVTSSTPAKVKVYALSYNILNSRDEKQSAKDKWIFFGNPVCAPYSIAQLLVLMVPIDLKTRHCQTDRETPYTLATKGFQKPGQENNLGMVITRLFGQSAANFKVQRLNDNGSLGRLKIQSRLVTNYESLSENYVRYG